MNTRELFYISRDQEMDRRRAQVLALQWDARHRDGDQEPIEEC